MLPNLLGSFLQALMISDITAPDVLTVTCLLAYGLGFLGV